jgi:hypothetical protein
MKNYNRQGLSLFLMILDPRCFMISCL